MHRNIVSLPIVSVEFTCVLHVLWGSVQNTECSRIHCTTVKRRVKNVTFIIFWWLNLKDLELIWANQLKVSCYMNHLTI